MKIIIIFIFVLLVFFIINSCYIYSRTNGYRLRQFNKFQNISDNIDIMVVGSGSGVYDIDENMLGDRAINLCVWPQNFTYDFRIVKYYADKLSEKGTIIHVISPLSFSENNYVNGIKFNIKYSNILPSKFVDVNKILYYIEKYFPSLIHINDVKRFLFSLDKKNYDCVETELSTVEKKQNVKKIINGWLKTNIHLQDFTNTSQLAKIQTSVDYNINQLYCFKTFCESRGFKYFPVIAPMSNELKVYFGESFIEEILYNCLNKAECMENVIDFLDDNRFDDINLYQDGLFLNSKGRYMLTKNLIEKLF